MRAPLEVVPKLGAKPGMPALRIGGGATYDPPIEHLAGQLDVIDLKLPLRATDGRDGLVLCFALGGGELERLRGEPLPGRPPGGPARGVGWEKGILPPGAPN